MKHTPFTEIHKALDAKMMEFAGYNMPVEYSGVKNEHMAVRESAGMFDVSHMGEYFIKGPGAFELVQKLTSNDISKIREPGKIQYNCLPNGKGGIVDDLLVYHMAEDEYMLVVNAANKEKDWNWIVQNNTAGAEIEDRSEAIALLAIQGPNATEILQKLTDDDLSAISFYTFKYGSIAGAENAVLSATGYTGSGGFELYIDPEDGPKVWKAIMEAGRDYGLKPAGLAARDTLRLEMGMYLYGNDIDETTSPIEANLSWITKFNDGNDFIDRPRLEKQKEEGVTRKLRPFVMEDKGIPRHGYKIVNESGEEIGYVTSGTMSPMLNYGIGLGYIRKGYTKRDTQVYIQVRRKQLKARVSKLPFVQLK